MGKRPDKADNSVKPEIVLPPGHELANGQNGAHALHYDIQIHLPTTTDIAVYNAIFKSLKEHLL